MKEIEIKDKSGQIKFTTPANIGAKGKFSLMQEDYIILPFSVKEPVSFKMGDYVDLSETLDESLKDKFGKIYEVVDKQNPVYNSSTGGYDYQLRLDAYYWKWKNKIFRYTPENTASEASWSLTAALDVQLGVFLRNLKALGYTYRGVDFTFSIDSTVEDKAVAMTYDNINLLDALFSMAGEDKWNCDCWITDNVIHFGRCEFGDAVKIERDVEAALISKTESKGDYGTRIIAFGSTNNIPTNYRKKFIDTISFIQGDFRFTGNLHNTNYYLEQDQRTDIRILTGVNAGKVFNVEWDSGNFYFESGITCNASVGDKFEVLNYSYKVPDRYLSYGADDILLNGVVQRRLMLPEDTPYIDLYEGMTDDEAIEKIVTFDDVFPRMDGVLSDVHTRTAEEENKDGTKETVTYYRYKDENLNFKEEYKLDEKLRIKFQSGLLNGLEFEVLFNPLPKDEDRGEQLWEIVLNENYGRRLPDDVMYPANGDKYVLLGFDTRFVGTLYVPDAEQELKEKTQKYVELIKNNDGTFPVTLKSTWVYENISSRLYGVGQRVNLIDNTYFENGRLSRVLGYEINLDYPWDSPIYTIGESASYSRIQELEDKVDALVYKGQTYVGTGGSGGPNIYVIKSNDNTQATDYNVFSALKALATLLRKDQADTMPYLLTLLKGAVFGNSAASIDANGLLTAVKAILQNIMLSGDLKSDNFLAGVLGTGYGLIKRDADGKSYFEVDKIFARVKAIFAVLEIMKVTYTGGNFVFSPAGMNCTKVEEYDEFYRCYFLADDGEKAIENTFEVDDFVQLREFNVKAGVYENVANRYFWRRCIAKGDDYIDLSKTDRDMTSDDAPMAGDALVTMGNKTIKSRQNVIIISVYGEGSPSIIQYEGINTYSLDGKAKTVISPNGNKFTGSFTIQTSGKDVEQELADLNDKMDNLDSMYRMDLTNEVSGVAAAYDGTVTGELPYTDINVFAGNKVDTGWTFIVEYEGCAGNVEGSRLTITALTADNATATITASKTDKPTLIKVMSIYKVKAGAAGAAGKGVKSTAVTYQASASGTTAPTGTWTTTIPSVAANQYLWSRTVITYTDGTTSTSYSVGKMGATGQPGEPGAPGEDGDGIVSIETTYQIGSSATVAPTGTWSSTIPAAQKGKYLWARTITTYKKSDPTTAYSVSYYGTDGTNASYITVSGEQVMKYAANYSGTPTPSSIVLTATLIGLSGYQWSYKQAGQTSFTNISGATSSTYTLAHNTSIWGSAKSITLRCTSGGKHDEVTIVKVADGAKGDAGDAGGDAYTIILGNESHTFAGTTNAAIAATTKVTVIAYKGATQIAATIGTPTGMPTGMTHTITSNGTTSAYITFAVTTAMTTANGVVNIPITADGKSFTKQFSYAISFKGSTGDAAVVYSIQPSVTQVIKSSTGTLTPTTVTCAKYKTVGNGAATITTEKTLKYQRLGVDSAEVAYSGAVVVTAETKSVVFSLYNGTTLLDRENVPVLSDASDLMLGGVNLIPDSDNGFLDTLKIWPDNTAKYSYTDNDGWRRINLLNGNFVGDQIVHEKYLTTEEGVDFTFSVILRTNGTITSKPYFKFRDRNTVHSKDVTATIESRGSNMYRLWATCAGGLSDNLLVFQLMNFATSGATYAEFRYPQLEYGNRPTPWREAPEDLGAKFEVLHDQIKSEIHAVEIRNMNLLLNSDIDMMDSAQGYNIGSEFYVNVQKTKDGWWRINCPDGVTDGEFFIEEYMEGLIQEGVYTESIEMRSDSNVVAGLQFYSKYGVYPIISSEQTKIGTNHWRLEGTFRVLYENAGVRKVDVAHISAPNATYVEFRFPMFTEGAEYVPWQPAAEDETGLRVHVTRHDSEISQLSNEISLKVSKTDYDENNKEISKQFSEIKQTATEISLKVDEAVGGENLIDNSSFTENLSGWSKNGNPTTTITTLNGTKCLKLTSTKMYDGIFSTIPDQYAGYVNVGEIFTISLDLYRYDTSVKQIAVGFEDNSVSDITLDISTHPIREWKRVSLTQTLKTTRKVIVIYSLTSGTIYIKNIKVERGSKATPWTASENDRLLATGIDIKNRNITVTTDQFTVQNNNGETTAKVNKDGVLEANGDVFKNITLSELLYQPIKVITQENFSDYVIIKKDNTTSLEILLFDIEKAGFNLLFTYVKEIEGMGFGDAVFPDDAKYIGCEINVVNMCETTNIRLGLFVPSEGLAFTYTIIPRFGALKARCLPKLSPHGIYTNVDWLVVSQNYKELNTQNLNALIK